MKRLIVPPLPAASRPSKGQAVLLFVGLARHQVAVGGSRPCASRRELVVGWAPGACGRSARIRRAAQHVDVVGRGAVEDGLERVLPFGLRIRSRSARMSLTATSLESCAASIACSISKSSMPGAAGNRARCRRPRSDAGPAAEAFARRAWRAGRAQLPAAGGGVSTTGTVPRSCS